MGDQATEATAAGPRRRAHRAVVAQLNCEANSFNPRLTTDADFTVSRGAATAERYADVHGSVIEAALRVLGEQRDVDVRPSLAAIAPPGGPVDDRVFEAFRDEIVRDVHSIAPELVVLDLHGAMQTPGLDDPEADLVDRLRNVAPHAVIAVGLDLHAHVTSSLLNAADVVVGCKTNPHADFSETGERLTRIALAALRGASRPSMLALRVPLVLAGNDATDAGPLSEAHSRAAEHVVSATNCLDLSIFTVQNLLDAADARLVLTAVVEEGDSCPDHSATESPAHATAPVMRELGEFLWAARDRFELDLPDIPTALDEIADDTDRPWVLADFGDRVLSGGAGDGTEVLASLMSGHRGLRAVVPITDPAVVQAAQRVGVGGHVRQCVGGSISPGIEPVLLDGVVAGLSDGTFLMEGPLFAGQQQSMGPTAVIRADRVDVLATTLPAMTNDRGAFLSQGIDPADYDVTVVKSGYHFRMSFEGIGRPIVALGKGVGAYVPGVLAFTRRGGIYPDDPSVEFEPNVESFPSPARPIEDAVTTPAARDA